ncbi:MAG: hypothetical protein V4581_05575 [Bacteroidota bacterium]
MNIQKTVLSLAAILLFGFAQAQVKLLKSEDEARALSLKSVINFKDGKIAESFTALKAYWPLPEDEIDLMTGKTVNTLAKIDERFGEFQSYFKLKEETIKDTAIREIYIIKYKYHALRLIFTYYKNNSGWILNGFAWDDKYTEEFK